MCASLTPTWLQVRGAMRMMGALMHRVVEVAHDFIPQGLSNSLWALAKLRADVPEATTLELKRQVAANVDKLGPQELANTMWAMAEADMEPSRNLSSAMIARAVALSEELKPGEVVQVHRLCNLLGFANSLLTVPQSIQ